MSDRHFYKSISGNLCYVYDFRIASIEEEQNANNYLWLVTPAEAPGLGNELPILQVPTMDLNGRSIPYPNLGETYRCILVRGRPNHRYHSSLPQGYYWNLAIWDVFGDTGEYQSLELIDSDMAMWLAARAYGGSWFVVSDEDVQASEGTTLESWADNKRDFPAFNDSTRHVGSSVNDSQTIRPDAHDDDLIWSECMALASGVIQSNPYLSNERGANASVSSEEIYLLASVIWEIRESGATGVNRVHASLRAQKMLAVEPIIFDTETTGLGDKDQIVEISCIASTGDVLLDTLVRPTIPVPEEATAIHGISNDDLVNVPTIYDLTPRLHELFDNKTTLSYNIAFDRRLLKQSLEAVGIGWPKEWDHWWGRAERHCIMQCYAEYWGAWHSYHESYTWQSLINALDQCGLVVEGNLHRALTDTRASLALLKHMASYLDKG